MEGNANDKHLLNKKSNQPSSSNKNLSGGKGNFSDKAQKI